MIVIPAIDLRGGPRRPAASAATPSAETAYADDPVEVAARFQEEGARRLHVIDLDAALEEGENREVVREICQAVVVPVQVGGGVRTLADIDAVLELGAGAGDPRAPRPRSTRRSWRAPSRSTPSGSSSPSTSATATRW